jgi:hypothetical protein
VALTSHEDVIRVVGRGLAGNLPVQASVEKIELYLVTLDAREGFPSREILTTAAEVNA